MLKSLRHIMAVQRMNEAIYLDYVMPLRFLPPVQPTTLQRWVRWFKHLKWKIESWKRRVESEGNEEVWDLGVIRFHIGDITRINRIRNFVNDHTIECEMEFPK